jgi:hypothetical protein
MLLSELIETLHPKRFETAGDLAFYLSGDVVTCLVCNKSYKNLAAHLNKMHDVDDRDYKEILNIPYTCKLISAETKKNMKAATALRHSKKTPEQIAELMKKCRNPGGNKTPIKSTIAQAKIRAASQKCGVAGAGRVYEKVKTHCFKCKSETLVGRNIANTKVYCESCGGQRQNPEHIRKIKLNGKQHKQTFIGRGIVFSD